MTPRERIHLARQARNAGDLATALAHQHEAVALLRAGPDEAALAHAIRHVGDMLVEAGRAEEAGPAFAAALALYRALPDAPRLDVANAVRGAAVQAQAIGDTAAARALWQEARDRYAALDELFARLLGKLENPGVAEAESRLAALSPRA